LHVNLILADTGTGVERFVFARDLDSPTEVFLTGASIDRPELSGASGLRKPRIEKSGSTAILTRTRAIPASQITSAKIKDEKIGRIT
jgi:hypothetical protein